VTESGVGSRLLGRSSDDNPPLVDPAANLGLLSVFRRTYLLRLLVGREVTARYSGSVLGLAWSYVNPLTQFLAYWLIVGNLLEAHMAIPNYPMHILTALLITHFFTETFAAGTASIHHNKALVIRMPIPKEMFPVASMLVSLIHVLPEILILSVGVGIVGWHGAVLSSIAWALMAFAIVIVLGTAVALLFSVLDVYFRDFGSIVGILTFLIRFAVPMMYPFSKVAEIQASHPWIYWIYTHNPVVVAIECLERAFWFGTVPKDRILPGTDLIYATHANGTHVLCSGPGIVDAPAGCGADVSTHGELLLREFPGGMVALSLETLGVCFVLLLLAQWVFNKFEAKIPERL
jgi:ABC-2 type transport system permease protein